MEPCTLVHLYTWPFYWVAMGYPVLKWASFFFFFFSSEKLQFLRNIACIRLNNDADGV